MLNLNPQRAQHHTAGLLTDGTGQVLVPCVLGTYCTYWHDDHGFHFFYFYPSHVTQSGLGPESHPLTHSPSLLTYTHPHTPSSQPQPQPRHSFRFHVPNPFICHITPLPLASIIIHPNQPTTGLSIHPTIHPCSSIYLSICPGGRAGWLGYTAGRDGHEFAHGYSHLFFFFSGSPPLLPFHWLGLRQARLSVLGPWSLSRKRSVSHHLFVCPSIPSSPFPFWLGMPLLSCPLFVDVSQVG